MVNSTVNSVLNVMIVIKLDLIMAVAKFTKSFPSDTAADLWDFEQRVRLRFNIESMEVVSIFGV